ncbi:MAG: cytochrome c maturation protein CcmE [Labilithrix sp.]|nr:cytochrome c maturation protein CcmE [Labilithrix sp.]MCW5834013.1 cytochrome c maturation protein CcmE [Labilithrix sp.]
MSDAQADENLENPPSSERAVEVPARRRRDDGEDEDEDGARKRLLLVVPLLMAAAAIVALVLVGMQDKGIYSKPVDELVAQKEKFVGKPVRAEGNLVHGSLVKREDPCEYRFKIEKNGTEIPVRFAKCVVPDTFRDVAGMDVAVTVEGELRPDDSLEASQVLAKCPSKYEMKQKAAQGEKAPHAVMGP